MVQEKLTKKYFVVNSVQVYGLSRVYASNSVKPFVLGRSLLWLATEKPLRNQEPRKNNFTKIWQVEGYTY